MYCSVTGLLESVTVTGILHYVLKKVTPLVKLLFIPVTIYEGSPGSGMILQKAQNLSQEKCNMGPLKFALMHTWTTK